jgi:hypothetical protein
MKTPGPALPLVILSLAFVSFTACRKAETEGGELDRIAQRTTDKASFQHGFLALYERFFSPLRNSATKICEIGIAKGGSLLLWEKYFPKAAICGIDIRDKTALNSERIKTYIADQADRTELAGFIEHCGGDYDIILDDGGHLMPQQQISFGFLFRYVKPGGYYIIEDLQTSLPELFPGIHQEKGGADSTLTMINHFIEKREVKSLYLTGEEQRNLERDIEYVVLFRRNKRLPSITSIIKKKELAPPA